MKNKNNSTADREQSNSSRYWLGGGGLSVLHGRTLQHVQDMNANEGEAVR